jgi:anti-anti-sigma factor
MGRHDSSPSIPAVWTGPGGFEAIVSNHAAPVVVKVRGELDIATAPVLAHALENASAAATQVVLDVGSLEFVDCRGVGVVLAAHTALTARSGRLVMRSPSAFVRKVFTAVGASYMLEEPDPHGPQTGLGG